MTTTREKKMDGLDGGGGGGGGVVSQFRDF